jgi:hypothetical protein
MTTDRPRNLKLKGWEMIVYDNMVFIDNPKTNLHYHVDIDGRMTGYNCREPGLFVTNVLTGETENIEKAKKNES